MRPVRLLLDGFGSYREPVDIDFTGIEFFALVGPTGSGKSTVIDGLCFALYGTVPRWGKENVIAQALAPAANLCRVGLVFEASGRRYAAVRELTRDRRGQVHTKEARLELLDPAIPGDAPLAEMLDASVEHLAEGPEQVKAQVEEVLGLTYEHFTQSVLLPQGRFSEFLHASAGERQKLLVQLLAFGVYDTVGRLARERAGRSADREQVARAARAELADATEEAEAEAIARVRDLTELRGEVAARTAMLRESLERVRDAVERADGVRREIALLAAVRIPGDVAGLAERIAAADRVLTRRRAERDAADQAEIDAGQARDDAGDRSALERFLAAYGEQRELAASLVKQEKALAERRAEQEVLEAALAEAEREHQRAEQAREAAERSHLAVALAQDLRVGADCPVCRRPVTALPHHEIPADLRQAKAASTLAAQEANRARATREVAVMEAKVAAKEVDAATGRLGRVAAALAGAPAQADVAASLEAIAVADERLVSARAAARAAREAAAAADRARTSLGDEEQRARAALGAARDSVVQFGAPAADGSDLAAAWAALTGWAKVQREERSRRRPELDADADAARREVADTGAALAKLLAEHGITDVTDVSRAEAAVAEHRAREHGQLELIRQRIRKAAGLDRQIQAFREDREVAALLGRLLDARTFQRWICGEALDSLVIEASKTLMELSGDQYQLGRDQRNELIVIDYQDAGAERPVQTLSGGETFQASLALALALSRQVVGLSAGMRELNSMFLDEGFGTLDQDTLEVVGSTLERLSTDSDRMIGIITHVPELARRAPVRFEVSRAGMTSTLRRVVDA
jgi:DNA repair protein SbcC/Rad50